MLFAALFLLMGSMAAAGTLPANVYLQNTTSAITFPSLAGLPACANTLGGACIGNDVISGITGIKGNLFVIGNLIIASGASLTDNGFYLSATVSVNSIGATIYTLNTVLGSSAGSQAVGNSIFTSFGGSGGGGGWAVSAGNGANGGNTIAPAGIHGTVSGPSPTSGTNTLVPALTTANAILWCNNPLTYLSGAAGGGGGNFNPGAGEIGGGGGSGSYGFCIASPKINLGTINANGITGGNAAGSSGGGGGGGGGVVIIIYTNSYTLGSYNISGGYVGFGQGGGANGATGGNGNVITYHASTNPLVEIPSIYPLKLYNATGTGITFAINQIYNGVTTSEGILPFIPPSNQPSGIYVYNIIESNGVSQQTLTLNLTVSMNDISSNLGSNYLCSNAIQYFPNCAVAPAFMATPTSWGIKSDVLANNHANSIVAGNNIDQWSNANLTFLPQVILSYGQFSPAIVFTANAVNNPILQTPISQLPFNIISSNVVPSSPYTRVILVANIYDQKTQTALSANTQVIHSWSFNNYTGLNSTFFNGTTFNGYIGLSNYQNPTFTDLYLSTSSSAANHAPAVNNFCGESLANGNYRTIGIYPIANASGSYYTFNIYSGFGQTPLTDFIQVLYGLSSSTAILVQQFQINQIPFQLPLLIGGEYGFRIVNANCQTVYSSNFTQWTSPITLQLPNNLNAPQIQLANPISSCTMVFTMATGNVASCTGSDNLNFVTEWEITIYNSSSLQYYATLNSINITGSAFVYNYNGLSNQSEYNVKVCALQGVANQPIFCQSYKLGGNVGKGFNVAADGFIALLFLIVGAGARRATGEGSTNSPMPSS